MAKCPYRRYGYREKVILSDYAAFVLVVFSAKNAMHIGMFISFLEMPCNTYRVARQVRTIGFRILECLMSFASRHYQLIWVGLRDAFMSHEYHISSRGRALLYSKRWYRKRHDWWSGTPLIVAKYHFSHFCCYEEDATRSVTEASCSMMASRHFTAAVSQYRSPGRYMKRYYYFRHHNWDVGTKLRIY